MTARDPETGAGSDSGSEAGDGAAAEPEVVSPSPPRTERTVEPRPPDAISDPDDDLPVVARVVVEIRSDGRRTVARGAIEDMDGNRAAVHARGDSPFQLAWQLARSLLSTPRAVTRSAVRSLLPGRRRRRDD